jgi:hypothetical protein
VNINLQSQTSFGDEMGLRGFFMDHRLAHAQIDNVIAQASLGNMPSAALGSDSALDAWVTLMREKDAPDTGRRAFSDWLQLHANLHEAEYLALGLGDAPDLGTLDGASEEQYYDWMYAHGAVHDTLDAATHIT